MNYQIDYGDLFLFLYISIIALICLLLIRRKIIYSFKSAISLIFIGILDLVIGITFFLIENDYNFNYLMQFLLFKDVGIGYPGLSLWRNAGYGILFLGIAVLIVGNSYVQRIIPKRILTLNDDKADKQDRRKIYISPESLFAYLIIGPLFLIIPIILSYFIAKSWITDEYKFSLALSIITLLLVCFLVFILILLRKYSSFKIETDDKGIIFYGFLRKSSAHWQEVVSITNDSPFLGKNVAVVKTVNDKFFFPLSIKEYRKWNPEEDTDKSIQPENCSLYI